MNKLVYETEGKKVEVQLSGKPVSLGRAEEADHQLPTKLASRIHAQVFSREDVWLIEDLGSSNGTIVNGTKIDAPVQLKPKDKITIGDMDITYVGDPPKPKGPPDELIARIVYQPGKGAAPIETLIRDRITIGRAPDNTLQIPEKAVSGTHAEIINRQGAYLIRDLGSSNGTFINKKRTTEHTLRNGDDIVLGKKISLYFVDPAAHAPQQAEAPAPAAPTQAAGSPPAQPQPSAPAAAPSSAAGASDRGKFSPVNVDAAARKSNPIPAIAIGVALGGLFVLAGWLLGDLIADISEQKDADDGTFEPEAPLADSAMSFEGEIDERGNPDGWTATFESSGTTQAVLLADPAEPFDGERSLSIQNEDPSHTGTLVLQTTKPRKFDFTKGVSVSIYTKGEGITRVALALSVVDEKGAVRTLATGSFVGVRSTQWGQLSMKGKPLAELPENVNLRLMMSANFSRLWLDRLEVNPLEASTKIKPFEQMAAPDLALTMGEAAAAEVSVANTQGNSIRFQPKLLAHDDANLTEAELWSVGDYASDVVSYTAMMTSRGDAAGVKFRANAYDNGYFIDPGLELQWNLYQGSGVDVCVDIVFPFPRTAELALADRRGYPMAADRDAMHVYAYATVSELLVSESNLSVSFPDGAVVWLDFSRPGELVATVRAGRNEARKSLKLRVNSRPLMFARLYDRLFDEAERMLDAKHYSAAKARLEYLTGPGLPDSKLPVIDKAYRLLQDVEAHRVELRERMDEAWETAGSDRTKRNVQDAQSLVLQYIAEFPGVDDIKKLNDRLDILENWAAQLEMDARPPDEMAEAEAIAKSLYADAETSFKAGHYLLALVMLENILRDYSDTSQFHAAQSMYAEINEKLDDPEARDLIIDKELARIDEDIKFEDYRGAREKCLELVKRFPDTPRNRDIMIRLRKIEAAFED